MHGQLFVALSRATSSRGVKVLALPVPHKQLVTSESTFVLNVMDYTLLELAGVQTNAPLTARSYKQKVYIAVDADGDAGFTVMQRGPESQLPDYLHSREQWQQDMPKRKIGMESASRTHEPATSEQEATTAQLHMQSPILFNDK